MTSRPSFRQLSAGTRGGSSDWRDLVVVIGPVEPVDNLRRRRPDGVSGCGSGVDVRRGRPSRVGDDRRPSTAPCPGDWAFSTEDECLSTRCPQVCPQAVPPGVGCSGGGGCPPHRYPQSYPQVGDDVVRRTLVPARTTRSGRVIRMWTIPGPVVDVVVDLRRSRVQELSGLPCGSGR